MKSPLFALVLGALLACAGCSSVDSRVKDNDSAFRAWPVSIQEKVRAGEVEMGFTREMVEVALGKADRRASRTTDRGEAEVWVYNKSGPRFSVGLGLGSSRGSTGIGGGVTLGDDFRDEENMRVIFEGGIVTAIERRK